MNAANQSSMLSAYDGTRYLGVQIYEIPLPCLSFFLNQQPFIPFPTLFRHFGNVKSGDTLPLTGTVPTPVLRISVSFGFSDCISRKRGIFAKCSRSGITNSDTNSDDSGVSVDIGDQTIPICGVAS